MAQVDVIMDPSANGQTFNSCSGALYASGGVSGIGYQNNENVTVILCPDVPGDVVTLDFITFNLSTQSTVPAPGNNADNFTVYDGNSTSEPTLGTYGGTQLQGLIVTCTSLNTSGCLTIVFNSNSAGTGNFAATITCSTPCQRPTAVLSTPTTDTLKICEGETVNFNGTPSFAAAGFNIDQYKWNFGDGTIDTTTGPVISHTYNTAGGYRADLYLRDDNGCASTNRVTKLILVGTVPSFTGTTPDPMVCFGENTCLTGVVTPTTYTGLPDNNLGGATYLPDNVGQCFSSTIDFNLFGPGATLNNINDLISICVNMEHSYIGDLVASIYCPDGTQVILYQQGGGWNSLGEPVDIMGPTDPPGVGYPYCWSPNAPLGTWAQCGNAGATPNLLPLPNGGETLAPGTYSSLNPLSDLVGCPLNGVWTLEFCDLWGADDGWVFDWEIQFNPALYPDIIEFTPVYGSGADSSYWTPSNAASAAIVTSLSADGDQICMQPTAPGSYSFDYFAIDDFGCTFDTTITVTVTPPPTNNAGTDMVVCPNTPFNLDGSVNSAGAPCDWTFHFEDTFGDGWNGASMTVTVNGVPTSYTLNSGTDIDYIVNMPAGATIDISYSPGVFEMEVSYTITDCNGNIILADGPNPTTGNVYSGMNGLDMVYSWAPAGNMVDPNIEDPTVNGISTPTTFYLTTYENGHPLCAVTDSVNVTIDPGVYAGLDDSLVVCYNEVGIDLNNNIGPGVNPAGTWVDPSGNAVVMPVNAIDFAAGGEFQYIVAPSASCPGDTAFVYLNVLAPTDPSCCVINMSAVSTNENCPGACDGTITISSDSPNSTFSVDGGITNLPDSLFNGLCAGNYMLYATSQFGCQDSMTFSVGTSSGVVAYFVASPQPTTTFSPEIWFRNFSQNATNYAWDFGPYGTSAEVEPFITFSSDTSGTYNVCLIASNLVGCADTFCTDVVISEEFVLYAPNAFTPDGDGKNEMFFLYGNDIDPSEFELQVFNRWGELIFSSSSLSSGWDGAYKGQKCPNDVYVWKVKAKSLTTRKTVEKFGHVVLIR
jgi:gliding motility-associated-like protein